MSGPAGGKSSRLQKLLALIDGEWRSCHDKDGGLLKRPLAVLICVSCAAAGGSSLATRKAAAAQIAGIATAHPAQLPAVLAAVSRHLRHSEWDARAAAGHCLGLLAEHFGHHTSAELQAAAAAAAVKLEQEEVTGAVATAASGAVVAGTTAASTSEEQAHLLSLLSFDVQQVVAQGTPMLASGGEVRLGSGKQLEAASLCMQLGSALT